MRDLRPQTPPSTATACAWAPARSTAPSRPCPRCWTPWWSIRIPGPRELHAAVRGAAGGAVLDDALRGRINTAIRQRLSPRFVPDAIEQVPEVPRTLSARSRAAHQEAAAGPAPGQGGEPGGHGQSRLPGLVCGLCGAAECFINNSCMRLLHLCCSHFSLERWRSRACTAFQRMLGKRCTTRLVSPASRASAMLM